MAKRYRIKADRKKNTTIENIVFHDGLNVIMHRDMIITEDIYLRFSEKYREKHFEEIKPKPKRKKKTTLK